MTVFGNDHAALPFLQRVYPFDHLEAIWLSKSSGAQGKLRIIVDMTLRGRRPPCGKMGTSVLYNFGGAKQRSA